MVGSATPVIQIFTAKVEFYVWQGRFVLSFLVPSTMLTFRGDGCEDIYLEEGDRQAWLGTLVEYRLRQALKNVQQMFPNQKGQPVENPTMRWIFQLFVGIHLLIIQQFRPWCLT
jgi:hypothetical protein